METFSALLVLCAGNSPVTGEFSTQRPVMRNFDVFFDLRLNKRLSKQTWGWWFETPSRSLRRHCNETGLIYISERGPWFYSAIWIYHSNCVKSIHFESFHDDIHWDIMRRIIEVRTWLFVVHCPIITSKRPGPCQYGHHSGRWHFQVHFHKRKLLNFK